ncbi:tetratricopeptide repeat protein [Paenibacillus larvae]
MKSIASLNARLRWDTLMFKQLFGTMNEVLDDIIKESKTATGAAKQELEEQLTALKAMSDECIEQWLLFEEKLSQFVHSATMKTPTLHQDLLELDWTGKQSEEFLRGQGYFKLYMYRQAIQEFEKLVQKEPDFLLARIYLAMGYLKQGELPEAKRHFQLLAPLVDNAQMKAITYNALGCIQFSSKHLDQAFEYFKKAYSADPSIVEPLLNLEE